MDFSEIKSIFVWYMFGKEIVNSTVKNRVI